MSINKAFESLQEAHADLEIETELLRFGACNAAQKAGEMERRLGAKVIELDTREDAHRAE